MNRRAATLGARSLTATHRPFSPITGPQGRGTAWDIWDGAICLALYLERVAEQLKAALGPADRRRVLELVRSGMPGETRVCVCVGGAGGRPSAHPAV